MDINTKQLKKYIFYTTEGFTQDLKNNDVENCQIIDWIEGKSPKNAFQNLKKENQFLKQVNFDNIMCQELLSNKVYNFSLNE